MTELLRGHIRLDAEMMVTDELATYRVAAKGYRHETVSHAVTYVNGNVHTQGVENFWSLLKRGIIGIYHRVSAKYLQAYVGESRCLT